MDDLNARCSSPFRLWMRSWLFGFYPVAAVVTACVPGEQFLPDLTFVGFVTTDTGGPAVATVTVQGRLECRGVEIVGASSVESGEDGRYELTAPSLSSDRCYVVFAVSTDSELVSDTMRLERRDLEALGDPFGSGRIPLDLEVSGVGGS